MVPNFPMCTVRDLKQSRKKKISMEIECVGKLRLSKEKENDGNILQLLVGRIMQFSTMQSFVIVTS